MFEVLTRPEHHVLLNYQNHVMLNEQKVSTRQPVTSLDLCDLHSCVTALRMIHGKADRARTEADSCPVNDTFLWQEELAHLIN